ncbi:uncharacterized protein LOC132201215 [Neocloeon triangulifer]|uniref:uncharacterized protein LOC132201215 n=1 Tax=Neocloeon triangulifer TaxID=2078957 RepID=UPI00286F8246|nr:uncharacterized protein LOC132201215 [Neocloeon triangulifer]XP_059483186.1 uncharacterized protein LOC132201215 [Neocloeon triangulifer]
MSLSVTLIAAATFLLAGNPVGSSTVYQAAGVSRHSDGDTFYLKKDGAAVACSSTLCADSRALPSLAPTARNKDNPPCFCKCPAESPVFREDLHVCVDDFHECSLASFQNVQRKQRIPFVFLPMKGQIIHPSSDIAFNADVGEDPICVVSSAQFLTRSGWLELRNTSDTEPPLRLFRDQRHTFLQWLGEQDLRFGMEGRILLARLMCKDPNGVHHSSPTDDGLGVITHTFSTPCIAFRVAGSQGAREVMFTSDYSLAGTGGLLHGLMNHENRTSGLSTLEYLAVGLCIMLLCLVYATSVIVYIHVRRVRRKKKRSRNESGDDSDSERGRGNGGYGHRTEMNLMSEGVVKNNPLLMASAGIGSENFTKLPSLFHKAARSIRLPRGDLPESMERDEESSADEEVAQSSPRSQHSGGRPNVDNSSPLMNKISEIKVQIHPESSSSNEPGSSSSGDENQHSPNLQTTGIYTLTLQPPTESGSLERHPGESVSIVETLDEANGRDGRDYSFLGGRHTFNSSGMGLPESESGCNGACNGSQSHSGHLLGGRKKLYFNPAYFDPEMLQSPPPAAVEFLQKLREVVAMSKIKIAAKKYNPSLMGIPEEGNSIVSSRTSQSVNGYTKQENWRVDATPAGEGTSACLPPSLDVCGSKQQTIRRWLEDLDSGEPVEDQVENESVEKEPELPPMVKEPSIEAPKKPARVNTKPPQPKRLMDAVIKELVRERGLLGEDVPSSETTTSGEKSLESTQNEAEENPYELIAVSQPTTETPNKRPPLMMYCLPELLAKTSGYNLVSEVYVNDDYSCSSNQSSSSNSTINRHTIKQRPPKNSIGTPSDTSSPTSSVSEQLENNAEAENYPGSLTIKLPEAPAHEYVERREEDQFEPDTLDRNRKNSKHSLHENENLCADSLERPMKIQLKSSGSFFADAMHEQHSWGSSVDVWAYGEAKKRRGPSSISDLRSNNIAILPNLGNSQNTGFGSLREIFEAKRQQQMMMQFENILAGPPGDLGKGRAARSLIAPNEMRIRANGMGQASIDDIRQMMWSATPEVLPRPKPKPKRQRTADGSACPPTPPPPVPPSIGSIPPSLPPKQKHNHTSNPPLPPREPTKPVLPPSLPPKNLRGCRSPPQTKKPPRQMPPQLPNLITSHSALHRASADSEEDDHNETKEGNLGKRVEGSINNAFSKWKKTKWEQETSIKMPNRPGDSGYLSSDSNNSLKRVADEMRDQSSEDEGESLCEAGSESGAESVGTDSFFYNKARPQDSVNFGEKRREVNVLLPHVKKKQPPPPPKRVNSKLEPQVLQKNNLVRTNLSAKYGL